MLGLRLEVDEVALDRRLVNICHHHAALVNVVNLIVVNAILDQLLLEHDRSSVFKLGGLLGSVTNDHDSTVFAQTY